MKKIWIYILCIITVVACTQNNSLDVYEEEGNAHKLKISTSLFSIDPATHNQCPLNEINIPDSGIYGNSQIGICTYRSGKFQAIRTNAYKSDQIAENILSVKENSEWSIESDIYLREPVNVYAYYPYTRTNFCAGKANDPAITSDDESPSILLFPGQTDYLYGKAEKAGSTIAELITPLNNQANIRFRHAMAFVSFCIKNESGKELTLKRIALNGICAQAKLSIADGGITPSSSQTVSMNLSDYHSGEYNNMMPVTIPEQGIGHHAGREQSLSRFHAFVIPQKLTDRQTITLTLNGEEYTCAAAIPEQTEWKQGRSYLYTLKITDNSQLIVETIQSIDR